MTSVKIVFRLTILFLFMNYEAFSWTIDLNDIRKHVFDKNDRDKVEKDIPKLNNDELAASLKNNDGSSIDKYYDNALTQKYADNYGYEKSEDDKSYMERKIHHILSGSNYLEGLRRSLEIYSAVLVNCTRMNNTLFQNMTTNSTWRPPVDFPSNLLQNMTVFSKLTLGDRVVACRRASQASERVRQLSQLALKATKNLQDIAYAKKYEELKDYLPEENELILKLAWFLDRLAHYTGYVPDTNITATTAAPRAPIPVPPPLSLVNAPDDVKMLMMNCLKENSTVPATERCRYPLPLSDFMRRTFNITDTATPSQPTSSSSVIKETVVLSPSENMELLIATDARQFFYPFINSNDNIQSGSDRLYGVQLLQTQPLYTKVDLSNYPPISYVKNVKKRSIENPLAKIVNYYSKYKVWVNSNSDIEGINENMLSKSFKGSKEFEVTNYLPIKSVQKRSITENSVNKNTNYIRTYLGYNKDYSTLRDENLKSISVALKNGKSIKKRSLPVIQLPVNPTQDLSNYVKHKPGVHHNKNKQQAEKIREFMKKLRNKSFKRSKRSLKYEEKFLPRISENPFQDTSYYIKNKPGTNNNRNPVQAAQARAGLERIFQTGNIEVVRRFGSNYNPLVPSPFYAGVLLSASDV